MLEHDDELQLDLALADPSPTALARAELRLDRLGFDWRHLVGATERA
jgi:hypothetical protein